MNFEELLRVGEGDIPGNILEPVEKTRLHLPFLFKPTSFSVCDYPMKHSKTAQHWCRSAFYFRHWHHSTVCFAWVQIRWTSARTNDVWEYFDKLSQEKWSLVGVSGYDDQARRPGTCKVSTFASLVKPRLHFFQRLNSPFYSLIVHFTTELWSHWRWELVNCGFICSRERNECKWSSQLCDFFFQASLHNCINCDHNFEDHPSFDFFVSVVLFLSGKYLRESSTSTCLPERWNSSSNATWTLNESLAMLLQ